MYQNPAPYRPFDDAVPAASWVDRLAILSAIVADEPVTCMYEDADGVVSYRTVIPRVIERCKNGETIVRVHDCQRRAPRSFVLSRISRVLPL